MTELRWVRRKMKVVINPNLDVGYWAEHVPDELVPTELVLQQFLVGVTDDGKRNFRWEDVPIVDE